MTNESPSTNPSAENPRRVIELAVQFLIDALDAMDGDPDLEATGDLEPDLAASGGPVWSSTGIFDGRELDPAEQDASLLIRGGNELAMPTPTRRAVA